jgi:hypothetical protein
MFTLRPYVNGSYYGYTLAPDYVARWEAVWNSTIQPNLDNSTIIGVWLGDEVCWNGVTYAELVLAADAVRNTWPTGVCAHSSIQRKLIHWRHSRTLRC